MKKLVLSMTVASMLLACSNNETGGSEASVKNDTVKPATTQDTSKKSIPSEASEQIGNANIKISYQAPAVRGRQIWGGLVPYDAVWVTGAHKATALEVSKDFEVGGKTIPAGKYAIFTIPGKEEWTVIINKTWDQHLADDYQEAEDLVRVKVKPQTTEAITERLTYSIEPTGGNTATIVISWEKLRIPFAVKVL